MDWEFLLMVVVDAVKLTLPKVIEYFTYGVDDHEALAIQYQQINLIHFKLNYLQNQNNGDWTIITNTKLDRELQEFIQLVENNKLEKNFDFHDWCLQQQKNLQLQLLQQNHTLQRKLVGYHRENALKTIEEQKRIEKSPIWLLVADILHSPPEDRLIPLRVFFAPPKLQLERFAKNDSNLPNIELTLAEGLRQFFRQYCNSGRPIDFLGGTWTSQSFHSEASIKALFSVLKSEPTLVLESEIDGDYLNSRLGYWGLNWSKYCYEPVISRLPYRAILNDSAKERAQNWLKIKYKLIAAGEKPDKIDRLYGGDNAENLVTLRKEEKLKHVGIDVKNLGISYSVNKKDLEYLYQFLIFYNCLFAGLIIDEYFLVQYNLPPLLPLLLPELASQIPKNEFWEQIIEEVISYYQKMYRSLEGERSSLIPELILDLAQSLTNFPDRSWAEEQIIYSVESWLKLHDLYQPDNCDNLLQALASAITEKDLEYVEKLNQCLAGINKEIRLNVKDSCYQRAKKYFDREEYRAAILDFSRAIEIAPEWQEAYYNRGLAYAQLEKYELAIFDYTQAIKIDNDSPDTYNNRGNAYYKLGDYDNAIKDYDRAIALDPEHTQAQKNKDIVSGVLEELQRQQQPEEKTKNLLENL
ncbi:MAG: tetratricopeptide repeat protein [Prochloraceae cyanobacterium]|nr:tetratricopeptide repeat protein [Prochloraceae cyanobacterium]